MKTISTQFRNPYNFTPEQEEILIRKRQEADAEYERDKGRFTFVTTQITENGRVTFTIPGDPKLNPTTVYVTQTPARKTQE